MKYRFLLMIWLSVSSLQTMADSQPGPEPDRLRSLGDAFLSDFYHYPDHDLVVAGRLLRQQALEASQSLMHAAQNLRVLYTSTDGVDGVTIRPVSGAVYLPHGEPPPDGWPLVSWSHGTVGIADPCAPSWNGRQSQDEDYLNAYLSAGYAVVASDYQGLGTAGTHPYLATRPAAFSNLDLIRAAQQAGLPISAKVLMLGQSQGASAAIATAGLAAEYAPTVEVVGVIATGSPYFTPAAMAALSRLKQPDAPDPRLGYTFLAMTLAEQLETDFIRQDYITDEAWPIAEMVNTLCYHDLRQQVQDAGLTRRQSFQRDPMQGLQTAFVAMGYPRLLLPVPVFMGIGGEDRDTPPKMQLQLARSLCKAGTRVTVHQYPDLDHRQVVPGSVADSMTFARALFDGHTPEDSCDAILD